MSPTALSHLENSRPGTSVGEDTLRGLARFLMLDPWELLLRDGRVPAEIVEMLHRDPAEGAERLRRMMREAGE